MQDTLKQKMVSYSIGTGTPILLGLRLRRGTVKGRVRQREETNREKIEQRERESERERVIEQREKESERETETDRLCDGDRDRGRGRGSWQPGARAEGLITPLIVLGACLSPSVPLSCLPHF